MERQFIKETEMHAPLAGILTKCCLHVASFCLSETHRCVDSIRGLSTGKPIICATKRAVPDVVPPPIAIITVVRISQADPTHWFNHNVIQLFAVRQFQATRAISGNTTGTVITFLSVVLDRNRWAESATSGRRSAR